MSTRSLATVPCRRTVISVHLSLQRFTFAIAMLVFAISAVCAQTVNGQTRLLRTPTVSASQIAFAYANNIWTVPRAR